MCANSVLDASAAREVTQTLRRRRKPFHINSGERREGEYKGIRPALGGMIGGLLATHVAHIGAAIVGRVGVHDFAVETGLRNAKAIALSDHRCGVDNSDYEVFGIFAAADKGQDAVVGVVGVNPFETVPIKLDLMEGGFGGVKTIEIADQVLDAAMGIVLEEMPVKTAGFAPFITLGEFLAHEEKFLARVGALIGVQQTEIGELLPRVAGHFVEKRVFSVDDFVVRERKQEIFREGVKQREREFVVLVFAMDGVVRKVF